MLEKLGVAVVVVAAFAPFAGCGGRAARSDVEGAAGAGGSGGVTVLPVEAPCVVAFHLDDCCTVPVPVRREELSADPCLIPISHENAISDETLALCAARRPAGCPPLGCVRARAPTRVAALDAAGRCAFADECTSDYACTLAEDASLSCACPTPYPHSVVEAEGCLYSELNHVVHDCPLPLCFQPGCGLCPPCERIQRVTCEMGPNGFRVCGPPFEHF